MGFDMPNDQEPDKESYEAWEREQDETARNLQDAAMLIRRLIRHVDDSKEVKQQAIDWLRRKNLMGSPLRDEKQEIPAVFNRPECPFHYCDQPAPYEACQERCHHKYT